MTSSRIALYLSILSASLSACSSTPVTPAGKPGAAVVRSETKPLVGAFEVRRYELANGLKLLIVEDHSSPTFAYQTWFNVGSRDEVVGKTGLAHLFEHLMFKATSNHPEGEFDHLLEGAGVEDENAFTSWDYTAYVQELPKDKLDLIAQLESDRMVRLLVNDESFKTEREVVQNERRFRNENSPDGMMFQELYGNAFTKHSYHWPVIGYAKDLEEMTSQDARNFYHANYSPNHATIVVVGDVSPSEVLKTVQKYYGGLLAQKQPAHEIPAEPMQDAARHKQLKLNIQIEKLAMGFKMPGIMSEDLPTLMLLDAILSGGKSTRLQRALVDKGIATNVDTTPMEQKDETIFLVDCNLQQGKKATQAEEVVLKELARLANEPVPAAEIERAKNRAQFAFYQRLDGDGEKANFLGKYETLAGNYEHGIEIQNQLMATTPEQLQKVVQKYFTPKSRTVITGVMQ